MTVRVGAPRTAGEGLRIGTVRRPPRGVPKGDYASQDWYDVWLPNLSPSPTTLALGRAAATEREWTRFLKRFRSEMDAADNRRMLDVLAALSHQTDFSVGCYCADESRCHRSVLRAMLEERGAKME
jgi:uncharacterized protein YeaO (DUF488 family)